MPPVTTDLAEWKLPVFNEYILNLVRFLSQLGAGCALPGLLAAKLGAHVTLSDAAHLHACRQQAARSAQLNDLSHIRVLPITWGEFTPAVTSLSPIDVILGSDCFYDPADFEDILVTVAYILERNPHAEFWASYQERRYVLAKINECTNMISIYSRVIRMVQLGFGSIINTQITKICKTFHALKITFQFTELKKT